MNSPRHPSTAERKRLEAMLVELPLPAESNLVAFDRAAALYEEIGAILADTTREHQRQIILAIVESGRATEGGVSEIRVRPEARPFFGDFVAGETVADEEVPQCAAVGCWRPRTGPGLLPTNRAEVFAAYALARTSRCEACACPPHRRRASR